MSLNGWMRQIHRWISILFFVVVSGIFITLGTGHKPVQWVYFLPLAPLGLLSLTGLYLFVRPYALRRRGSRQEA